MHQELGPLCWPVQPQAQHDRQRLQKLDPRPSRARRAASVALQADLLAALKPLAAAMMLDVFGLQGKVAARTLFLL